MQGSSGGQPELWDVQAVAGHLLKSGGVFAFLAEHREVLFPDAMFADLFPSGRGRPSTPGSVVAAVLVLQALHGLSDRDAAEAVTFDLRWKAACGLAVTAPAFHPTTLTYWRRRLAASASPERIFEAVRAVVAETGVLTGRTRRALDSTILDDAVATQDTVTQLIAAVRRVARTVTGGHELVSAVATAAGHDYASPGKPQIAWDDTAARDRLVDGLVRDARAVLAAVAELTEPTDEDQPALVLDRAAVDAVGLLALIAGQDVEWVPASDDGPDVGTGGSAAGDDGEGGSWRIARKVAPDRVISTVDPQSRHAHKTTSRRQEGFKAHVVVEPDTGIVTACTVTMAAGAGSGDATVGVVLLGQDSTLTDLADDGTAEVLGDSAYGTGEMLDHLHRVGHSATIKPWPVNPAVPGGFTVDDFTVTYDGQEGSTGDPVALTCPAGVARPVRSTGQVNFGAACRDCPLRQRCTTSRTGKSMRLRPHDRLARAHRVRAATDTDFAATYRQHRPAVERSIAWIVRGNRRLRYRGTTANNAWLHLRVTAINLRRLTNLGLHHTDGTWALT